jgi:hypothetical protein
MIEKGKRYRIVDNMEYDNEGKLVSSFPYHQFPLGTEVEVQYVDTGDSTCVCKGEKEGRLLGQWVLFEQLGEIEEE